MRGVLAIFFVALSGSAAAADPAFACIRVIRSQAGTPSTPTITLPNGYSARMDVGYAVAAPGEFHDFISGPRGVAHASISWPGIAIAAVIENDTYLPLSGDPANGLVTCDIPVQEGSLRGAWATLDVASYIDEPDLAMRVDHNHPGRRSGWYLDNPWTANQARAALNWIFSARLLLRDWGLHHQIARAGAGRLSILDFESVNPLHIDFPPHWHLIDYLPGTAGSLVPHYYMDDRGALIQNKIQVLDRQGQIPDRFLQPGQPMAYLDPNGATRFVSEIRTDGGLDLGPTEGHWSYSIVAGPDGTFLNAATVLRDGIPFATVTAADDVAFGVFTVREEYADGRAPTVERHDYDPLTGVPRAPSSAPASPVYGMTDPNGGSDNPNSTKTSSRPASRCGLGSGIAALAALALLRLGWFRSTAYRVGACTAAGLRLASSRILAATSHRTKGLPK